MSASAAARLRALRLYEQRRQIRARADIAKRDDMIRSALADGVRVTDIADAVGLSRQMVYEIKENRTTGRREQ